jgi:hypothetical protein
MVMVPGGLGLTSDDLVTMLSLVEHARVEVLDGYGRNEDRGRPGPGEEGVRAHLPTVGIEWLDVNALPDSQRGQRTEGETRESRRGSGAGRNCQFFSFQAPRAREVAGKKRV